MRLLESVLVAMLKRKVPILLVARSLLLEILLGHHVQLSWRQQLCVARRFLSGFFSDPICLSFLRCSAMSRTMRVERRHAAHEKCGYCHDHEKPDWLKFSSHELSLANHKRLLPATFYDAIAAVSDCRYSTPHSVLTDATDRGFNTLRGDPMRGARITSEEKSAISTYVGAGIAIVLVFVGTYFFFLTQKEKKETTTFDPNRPVPSDAVLKSRLKAEEYEVVRGNGSQTPFQNEFWNNEKTGIYVDVITLEPLFASVDKFDGHIGLPTFTKPISKDAFVEVPDTSNEMQRTQVRAKRSNARLGHVFPDPKSPTGQRYVVYSAAFHFVPVEQMKDRGYDAYLPLFDKK